MSTKSVVWTTKSKVLLSFTGALFVAFAVKCIVSALAGGLALSELVIPFVLISMVAEQLRPHFAGRSALMLKSVSWVGVVTALVLFLVSGWKGL